MRQLSAAGCDAFWAVFNRELVTPIFIGGWLLWQAVRGRRVLPGGGDLLVLILVGLLIQLVGNVCAQWSLGVVGLAVTIPAMFGAMIAGGAAIGRFWLKERVSARSMTAITLLVGSLAMLGVGAEVAMHPAVATDDTAVGDAAHSSFIIALAVAASISAGAVYALLSAAIRRSVTRTTTPTAAALLVTLMGVVSLGPICLHRLGLSGMLATPPSQFGLMFAAGTFNLFAFLALIHGLKRTTVVHANAVNASQVAMAAVAGIVLFAEPITVWLLLGVCLTIFGIVWIDRPEEAVEEIPPP